MRIIFSLGQELFLAVSRIYFWACNALRALQLKWTGSSLWLPWATILKTLKWGSAFKENARAKHFQGKKQKGFSSFLQNLSGVSSTSRLVHNFNPYWTWQVYPILYLESSSLTTHAGFRNEDAVNEGFPYLEVQEGSPDSNSDGRA